MNNAEVIRNLGVWRDNGDGIFRFTLSRAIERIEMLEWLLDASSLELAGFAEAIDRADYIEKRRGR